MVNERCMAISLFVDVGWDEVQVSRKTPIFLSESSFVFSVHKKCNVWNMHPDQQRLQSLHLDFVNNFGPHGE